MFTREPKILPEHIYPADDWRIVEREFSEQYLAENETIFSVANGYLGIRGTQDEGRPVAQPGTYINGFYESWPIVYGEKAFGFAKEGQTMLAMIDCTPIKLYVDDEPLYLPNAELLEYERALDMRRGTLDRSLVWETPSGKRVRVASKRLVSFRERHLATIEYEVTMLDADAPVAICSEIQLPARDPEEGNDPRRGPRFDARMLVPEERLAGDSRIVLGYRTERSGMTAATGVDHLFECRDSHTIKRHTDTDPISFCFAISARKGVTMRLVKYITYHTSRGVPSSELCRRAEHTLDRALQQRVSDSVDAQADDVAEFWERSDVRIRALDPRAQQSVRFNLFHLLQATARAEGTGVGARGLTGQAYEGHYFWDTEMYVLPFLVYTSPRIARNLLMFRYSHLDEARQRAREVSEGGALFPWRTINGKEASAYYAAGTAQYHINADIMFAMRKYVDATGDEEFLRRYGAEMLVETARLWISLGFHSDRQGGKFCIHGVTGPDEYNTVVNNNTFTNLMARENLNYAVETVSAMEKEHPQDFAALRDQTGLRFPDELTAWKRAADHMYVPFDKGLGIHPQDDSFLEREPWDLDQTQRDGKFPLLLYHHPLVIYRHQVIKQADIILAMFLLGHEFSAEQKKRNFEYYDPLTTGDSSLSSCIQAIVAAELGDVEKAGTYLRRAVLMDLADVGGNVRDGAHIASMGGTWMALAYGLGGMRDYGGRLSFTPHLPRERGALSFPVTFRGRRLRVELENGEVRYHLVKGDPLTFHHGDEEITLAAGESASRHAVT